MSQFTVSANELSKKHDSLSALKNTLKSQIEQFEAEGKKLDSMWEGEAKAKYSAAFTLDITKLKMFLKLVEDFLIILTTIISLYRSTEQKNISVASS